MAKKIYYLTLEDIKEICFNLVTQLYQFEEPVPDFETRFPEKLESILSMPMQKFAGKELYPNLYEKAACYFYFIIKNHPFLNGNKRLAIITTFIFLKINDYSLISPWNEMYYFALNIAGLTEDHKKEFGKVVTFIKKYSHKS